MKLPSKLPLAAAMVAFFLAAIGILSAVTAGLALAFFALIPLAAGTLILRKKAWGAYGFALFQSAQLLTAPLLFWHVSASQHAQVWTTLGLNLLLIPLFVLAGRALAPHDQDRAGRFAWIAVTCLFTLPLFFVRAFSIPSGSMENTLLTGDRVLVRAFPAVAPVRDEIVILRYPADRRQTLAKRIIGVPGDRIRIASRTVYRNGTALQEPYAVHKFNTVDKYRDNFPGDPATVPLPRNSPAMAALEDMLQNHVSNGEAVIPPGKYFVLGDNRDNSLDSRYWGFLDASDIVGKPFLIYDSKESPSDPTLPNGPGSGSRTRWSRIFRLL